MQFKEVIGQSDIKQRMIQSVVEDRVPHALLLAGPPGNGKIALALAYAQYLNCTRKTGADSCGVCSSCRKYAKLIHPDLHMTFPVIKSGSVDKPTSSDYMNKWRPWFLENPYPQFDKWMDVIGDENKQGAIYVDEARDLIGKLNKKSYEAEYKVSIIWLPETMNAACANKILKILEEPPEKTLFILVTEAENRLLATIRSRCQFIRVPKIADEDMQLALSAFSENQDTDLKTIARLARGNYFLALEMLGNDEQRSYNFDQFTKIMRFGYGRKLTDILNWADEMSAIGRVRQMGFLKYCGELLRENFISNLKIPEITYLSNQENEFSKKFSPFIHEKNVIHLFREFEKAFTDVSMNGNSKLIFTDLGFKVSKFIRL